MPETINRDMHDTRDAEVHVGEEQDQPRMLARVSDTERMPVRKDHEEGGKSGDGLVVGWLVRAGSWL